MEKMTPGVMVGAIDAANWDTMRQLQYNSIIKGQKIKKVSSLSTYAFWILILIGLDTAHMIASNITLVLS